MSKNDRDVDILLRQNGERQLADFDWDGLRRTLAAACRAPAPPLGRGTSTASGRR